MRKEQIIAKIKEQIEINEKAIEYWNSGNNFQAESIATSIDIQNGKLRKLLATDDINQKTIEYLFATEEDDELVDFYEDILNIIIAIDIEETESSEKNKQSFTIPVEWSVYSTVEIEAKTLEEAVKIFDETIDEISLPTDPDYIDGSFQRGIDGDGKDEQLNLEYYMMFNKD